MCTDLVELQKLQITEVTSEALDGSTEKSTIEQYNNENILFLSQYLGDSDPFPQLYTPGNNQLGNTSSRDKICPN